MSAKMREALIAYMAAGFGNSTDYEKQAYARRMAMEALAEQPEQGTTALWTHAQWQAKFRGFCKHCGYDHSVGPLCHALKAEQPTQPAGRCSYCLTYNGHQDGCIYAPPAPSVPEGWKLVPIRATDEMTKAVRYDEDAFGGKSAWPSDIWRDMVRAAPEPRP